MVIKREKEKPVNIEEIFSALEIKVLKIRVLILWWLWSLSSCIFWDCISHLDRATTKIHHSHCIWIFLPQIPQQIVHCHLHMITIPQFNPNINYKYISNNNHRNNSLILLHLVVKKTRKKLVIMKFELIPSKFFTFWPFRPMG